MKKRSTKQLTFTALVGALYVILSCFSNIFGLSFGPFQCRFSEALTVLPFLCPASVWGLFAGCLLFNILSPYGIPDLIFGSMATLLAGLLTARCKNKWLAPLPPVLCNGLIVGALLAYYQAGFTAAFPAAFAFQGFFVALGEAAACFGLGMPLLAVLARTGIFSEDEGNLRGARLM